ncbi:hypothetical protein [Amycolatopsis dendrobii]|uniref:Uncharacterized protein n=1 Tax=Amycolatopsis dendrobii TaxID=2760662 RepID=A0A7W3VUL1_9PSEU|nr:hypothetical protein [Amycolatopsis dendrobii]MBB1153504.1 hypothetical protein [Amycolatopsis dendrobii]
MDLICDWAFSHAGKCGGLVYWYDCVYEDGSKDKRRKLCTTHAEEKTRDLDDGWRLIRIEDDEIPELPPRQSAGDDEAAANRLLNRVKDALRAEGLFPGPRARAGVELDPAQGKHKVTVELYVDPNDA